MKEKLKLFFKIILTLLILSVLAFSVFHFPNPIREKLMQDKRFSKLDTDINYRIHRYYIKLVPDNAQGVGPGNTQLTVKDNEHFSFAVFGDTQMFDFPQTNNTFQQAVESLKKFHVSAVLSTGDLINRCDNNSGCADYKLWKNIMLPFMPITYEVMGNHDHFADTLSETLWQKYFNLPTNGPDGYKELTYSFNLGNSHFIILDSEKKPGTIDLTQRNWLENDLQKNTAENTFVFFHEPAFPASYKVRQSLDRHSEERNTFWSIIDKYNVTAVFNGHEHAFSMEKIDSSVFPSATHSINQIIIGDTDADERHDANPLPLAKYYIGHKHHFIIVDVNGKNIIIKLYSTDGTLIDTFNLS